MQSVGELLMEAMHEQLAKSKVESFDELFKQISVFIHQLDCYLFRKHDDLVLLRFFIVGEDYHKDLPEIS